MVQFTRPRAAISSPRQPRDARVVTAACEALEGRAYRSATYSVGDFDHDGSADLKVRGSSSKEHVVITQDPAAGTTTLWLDQDTNNAQNSKDVFKTFDTPFGTIDVDLSSGDDNLEFYAVSAWEASALSLDFGLGSGNDKLTVDASGGDEGGGGVFGSSLHCDFDLSSGNDTASIKMGAVDNGVFRLNLDAGSGSDTVGLQMLGDVATALADIDIGLGTGKNKLDVNSLATISGGGNFFLDIRGGSSSSESDQVTTHFTNDVENARLLVSAILQGGNDTFTNTFDLQDWDVHQLGYVRFAIDGGDGNDNLAVTRGGTTGAADIDPGGIVEVRLAGGNGNDKLNLDLGGNEENNRGLFLTGRLIGNLDGGAGDDRVSADLSFSYDPASFGDLNLSLFGGSGNDTMSFNLLDFFPVERDDDDDELPEPGDEPPEIPTPDQIGFTYGPTGYVTVDAGLGTDSTTLSGAVLTNVRVRASEKLTIVPFTDVFSS
jgi:hypothetical protein